MEFNIIEPSLASKEDKSRQKSENRQFWPKILQLVNFEHVWRVEKNFWWVATLETCRVYPKLLILVE